jgi:hypothetical protein
LLGGVMVVLSRPGVLEAALGVRCKPGSAQSLVNAK